MGESQRRRCQRSIGYGNLGGSNLVSDKVQYNMKTYGSFLVRFLWS